MATESIEHLDPEKIPWKKVYEGIFERVLHRDEDSRAYTRLVRFEAGSRLDTVLSHDFFEEFIVIDGALTDEALGKTFTRGMFAYRRPGLKHGPFSSPTGCLAVEVRYYARDKPHLS